MAITFSVSLSTNQITILQAIKADTDRRAKLTNEQRKRDLPAWLHLSHFGSGLRHLCTERLVENRVYGQREYKGKQIDETEWIITEKGRLILGYIELEIQQAAEDASLLQRSLEGHESSYWKKIDDGRKAAKLVTSEESTAEVTE